MPLEYAPSRERIRNRWRQILLYCAIPVAVTAWAGEGAVFSSGFESGGIRLIFSEYAEGSAFNKALEIYNPALASVTLDSCTISIYFNGSASPGTEIALEGNLPAGETYVVCDDGLDPSILAAIDCALEVVSPMFNGNDAVELSCNGLVLDVIGRIGEDPGAAWNVDGVSTLDDTLRRDCQATQGDTNGTDPFDPSLNFETAGLDNFDDFGQYICP